MSSVAEKLQRKSQRATATKQVRLKLVYVDFWSAVKLSFLIALTLGIILIVVSLLVWIVLDSTGIFDNLNKVLRDILGQPAFSVTASFSLTQVGLFAVVVAAALPTAQNVYVTAQRYQVGVAVAKDTVLLTTVLAIPAMFAVAFLLG